MPGGTCKTCKWWYLSWDAGVGRYQGECAFGQSSTSDEGTRFEVQVDVADDHNLNVVLRTGPDFGCIHHESK